MATFLATDLAARRPLVGTAAASLSMVEMSLTPLTTLIGVMPCSSLYAVCRARRRLVSPMAYCIEPSLCRRT